MIGSKEKTNPLQLLHQRYTADIPSKPRFVLDPELPVEEYKSNGEMNFVDPSFPDLVAFINFQELLQNLQTKIRRIFAGK